MELEYRDEIYYWVDHLIKCNFRVNGYNNQNQKVRNQEFPCKSEYLINIFTSRKYKPVKEEAINKGILSCTGPYITGVESYKYRIMPKYYNDEYIRVECTNKRLERRIHDFQARKKTENKKLKRGKTARKLDEFYHRLSLDPSVDNDKEQLIDQIYDKPDRKAKRQDIVNLVNNTIHELSQKEKPDSVIDQYGRKHCLITRLPKELRSYLRYKGEPITFLDITNSQPLFMYMYLRRYLGRDNYFNKEDRERKPNKNKAHPLLYESQMSFSAYKNRKKLPNKLASELSEYGRLCEKGILYQVIGDWASCSRTEAKLGYFGYVYGPGHGCAGTADSVKEWFARVFPFLNKIIKEIKRKGKGLANGKWYGHLACMMQAQEAEFIFEGVVKTILSSQKIPLISLHDSLGTIPEHVDMVRSTMLAEFAKRDVSPQVHTEDEETHQIEPSKLFGFPLMKGSEEMHVF